MGPHVLFSPRVRRLRAAALLATLASSLFAAGDFVAVGRMSMGVGPGYAPKRSVETGPEGAEVLTVRFPAYGVWEYTHDDGQTWAMFNFPGTGFEAEVGHPRANVYSTILEAQPGETVVVERVELDWSAKTYAGKIFPLQPPRPEDKPLEKVAFSPGAYAADEDVFAADRVRLGEARKVWKQRFHTLRIRPLRYNPAAGEVGFLRTARIHLRRFGSRPDDPAGVDRREKQHPGYLVVTPERFLGPLRPFLNFKRKRHPDLQVVTLEEVGATVGEIDALVEKLGSRGTENVLLVGHTTLLPGRPYDSPFDMDVAPDNYDADAVYRNMGADGFPSLMVGRFPVETEEELATVVAKTLRRLKHPTLYQSRGLFVAHEEGAPGKYQGNITEILDSLSRDAVVDLEPRLVLPAPPEQGGRGSRVEDLAAELERGVGLMFYRGHGEEDALATGLLDHFGKKYRHWYDMRTAVPPVFFSVACTTGRLTDETGRRTYGLLANMMTSDSLAISGGVGAIMPSPTFANDVFAWYLANYTYSEPQVTLGRIFNKALTSTLQYGFERHEETDPYVWMADLYNVYGDPELPVVLPPRR